MKIVYNDELYGELGYSKSRYSWKKIEPLLLPFNGKKCKVNFYIVLVDISYMETKYHLSKDFKMEDFPAELIKEDEELERRQKEYYKEHLLNPDVMMQKVEDEIVEEFYERRAGTADENWEKFYGEKAAKKIIGADTREKILNLVKFKEIVLSDDIVIMGKSAWNSEFGARVKSDGYVTVGPNVFW